MTETSPPSQPERRSSIALRWMRVGSVVVLILGLFGVGCMRRWHWHPGSESYSGATLEIRPTPTGADLLDTTAHGKIVGAIGYLPCAPDGARPAAGRRGWTYMYVYISNVGAVDRLIAYTNAVAGPRTSEVRRCTNPEDDGGTLEWAAFVAAVAAAILWSVRDARFETAVRLPHLVPIVIQLTLYIYWSIYWTGVADHVRSLVLQTALAFALDAAFSFARFRSWRIGLSPIPIVLSANLFAWFDPTGSVIVVATAIVTKALVRRAGHHIFNPSAAGLTAGAVYVAFVPYASWTGLFHTEHLAPNMSELVLLLGIFPLLRFRLALIPLGAALILASPFAGSAPGLLYPGTLIAITLFAADPATTPRTAGGRLLFGLLVGIGIALFSNALSALGHPDDFAKVLPVPIANLLAPTFDRIGGSLFTGVAKRFLDYRWTPLHAALWVAVVAIGLVAGKAELFEAAQHWTYQTPTVIRDADDVPRCGRNPAFCRAFSFVSEIQAWRRVRS